MLVSWVGWVGGWVEGLLGFSRFITHPGDQGCKKGSNKPSKTPTTNLGLYNALCKIIK